MLYQSCIISTLTVAFQLNILYLSCTHGSKPSISRPHQLRNNDSYRKFELIIQPGKHYTYLSHRKFSTLVVKPMYRQKSSKYSQHWYHGSKCTTGDQQLVE